MYAVSKGDVQTNSLMSSNGETSTKSVAILPNITSEMMNYQSFGAFVGLGKSQLQSASQVQGSMVKHENDDDDDFTGDESTTNDEWESSAKLPRMADSAGDYKVTSPSYSSTDSNGPLPVKTGKVSNRPTGPRKPRKDQHLTPEEEERRQMRRERNKQAAAKCRQKRVDLTNLLQAETECLETEQMRLKEEIKTFQREKDELELILNTHRYHCGSNTVGSLSSATTTPGISVSNSSAPIIDSAISSSTTCSVNQHPIFSNCESLVKTESYGSSKATVLNTSTPLAVVMAPVVSGNGVCRPNSFPTSSLRTIAMVSTSSGNSLVTFGLESMMDGHTGLTPITGMPSCAIAIVGQHFRDTQSSCDTPTTSSSGLTAL